MTLLLLDDHLVRDLAADELPAELSAAGDELGTTNLWLFRLVGAISRMAGGAISGAASALDPEELGRFRRELTATLDTLTVVPMRELLWSMADLQERHRAAGRPLSTAMVEALAAAHLVGADIVVASVDVGPNLRAAAEADGVAFRVIGS